MSTSEREQALARYVRAAFENITGDVASARAGRTDLLFKSACKLGAYIGAGVLTESEVYAALERAAHENGHVAKDGLKAVTSHIKNGITRGMAKPVDLSKIELRSGEARNRHSLAPDRSPSTATSVTASGAGFPHHDDANVERQIGKAKALWRRRKLGTGSPAETYLRSRGCTGPIPATIGFLAPSRPDHHTAMISAFGIAGEPEPGVLAIRECNITGIHLTLLRPDGSSKADVKPDKIMVGACKGAPIVLAPPNDLLGLVISEGIEDGLSIHEATGLGAWAAGSAGFMPGLIDLVPDYIDAVSIAAHPDPAGTKGANELARGLRDRGFDVRVLMLAARDVAA